MAVATNEHDPTESELRTALGVLGELGESAILMEYDAVLDATPAACRLLGYSREDLRALPSAIVLAPPTDQEKHRATADGARAGEPSPAHLEARVVTATGKVVPLDVTVTSADRPEATLRIVLFRPSTPERVVSREIVHDILLRAGSGVAREATLRALGRDVARATRASTIEDGIARFERDGLGHLRLASRSGDTFTFEGRGLIDEDKGRAACFLSLSFVEGLVAASLKKDALGTEVRCSSRGTGPCIFVVRARPIVR